MALTVEQKQALDNAILTVFNLVNTNTEEKYNWYKEHGLSYANIYEVIRENNLIGFILSASSTSISYGLSRLEKASNPIYCNYGRFFYDPNAISLDWNKTSFKKERNKIFFDCMDNLYYDFATNSFNVENFIERVCNKHIIKSDDFLKALKYEWLFNYIDTIDGIIRIIHNLPEDAYKEMPKGLYQAIEKNGNKLDINLLYNVYLYNKYGKFYKFACTLIKDSYHIEEVSTHLNYFLEYYTFDNLFKMIKNNLLNGHIRYADDIRELLELYYTLNKQNLDCQLDMNRDLKHNIQTLDNIKNAKKNELLAKQLQRLNFINGMSSENLIVVVPQKQEDKQNEGRMQNNCVGSYYDNRILSGSDLIYFIRKKTMPEKSYITCRYNLNDKRTSEYRTKNNCSVSDNEAINFINQLDTIIRQNLS